MADRAKFTVQLVDKVSGGARAAKRSLGGLVGTMGAAQKGTGRLSLGLRGTSGQLHGAARSVGSLGGALDVFKGNLLTMAATKIAGIGAAAVSSAFDMVTFGQNSRLAFDQLAKHDVPGEKLFEHARELAKRFGLDVMDTTKQYSKFLALQFDPAGADKLIRMGADLRALGNSAEDVKGVFLSLGQIKGKGRLQGEEMLQLAERGVSTVLIQEEIGKLMGGKSLLDVQSLQQAGKVTADIGLQAIENAINRKLGQSSLGEAGAKFADTTIDGLLGRMKSFAQDSGLTLVDRMTAPMTRMAGNAFSALQGWISSPKGAETIGRIADGLGRAAEFAIQLGAAFGPAFTATWEQMSAGASSFLGMFAGGDGKVTGELINSIGKGLGVIAAVAVGTAIAFGVVAAGAALLAGGLWEIGTAVLDGIVETLGGAIGGVISWWDTIAAIFNDSGTSLVGKMFWIGGEIINGLADGILALAWMPFEAIANVGTKVADKLANVLGIHSPSRVTMEMGGQLGRGLAIGTRRSESMVAGASADLASSSVDGFSAYGPATPAFSFGGQGGGAGGPVSVSITQHIDGSGGSAEEIGRIAARETRREIESFFRVLAMET